MKKIILFALLMAAVFSYAYADSPQAPNSFDQVERSTWEFQTLRTMCAAGKAPRYTRTDMFLPERKATRYELTDVIIDLLDEGRNLDDHDRQLLDRMKISYGRELDARGWKEKKQNGSGSPAEVGGDIQIGKANGKDLDGRIRAWMKCNLDDKTEIAAEGQTKTK